MPPTWADTHAPLDPLVYLGRVHRDEGGKVVSLEVCYDNDTVHIEDGDEFVTFTTVVLLETLAR